MCLCVCVRERERERERERGRRGHNGPPQTLSRSCALIHPREGDRGGVRERGREGDESLSLHEKKLDMGGSRRHGNAATSLAVSRCGALSPYHAPRPVPHGLGACIFYIPGSRRARELLCSSYGFGVTGAGCRVWVAWEGLPGRRRARVFLCPRCMSSTRDW